MDSPPQEHLLPGVPEGSSLPPEWRPTDGEIEIDRRVSLGLPPSEDAVAWFENAWSDGAIAARAEATRTDFPARPPLSEGYEYVPFAEGSRLVYNLASQTFARLIACVRGLVDAGIPTGVGRTQRHEHAERIAYVHRLCCDPDFDYRGESYMGTNSREWVLGCVYQRDRQEQSCKTRAAWYRLVAWALRELEDAQGRATAPRRSIPEHEHDPKVELPALLLAIDGWSETLERHAEPAEGGRVPCDLDGARRLTKALASVHGAASAYLCGLVPLPAEGENARFVNLGKPTDEFVLVQRVLAATGGLMPSIETHPGLVPATWHHEDVAQTEKGPHRTLRPRLEIKPAELIPARIITALERERVALREMLGLVRPASGVDVEAIAAAAARAALAAQKSAGASEIPLTKVERSEAPAKQTASVPPAWLLAAQSCAEAAGRDIEDPHEQWKSLREHGSAIYEGAGKELPHFETWQTYLRKYDKATRV